MDKAKIIQAVVKLIREHANPSRIWLFGSQANGDSSKESDIDLAFEDAAKPDLTALKAEINALPTLTKIDIHNIATTEERFANRVRDTGKVLYSSNNALRAEDGLYNFLNVLSRFQSIVGKREQFISDGYGDVYLDLAVKRFEFTYEMAWKAIKRYIQYLGLD